MRSETNHAMITAIIHRSKHSRGFREYVKKAFKDRKPSSILLYFSGSEVHAILKQWIRDNVDYPMEDFLGTVDEYEDMPVRSLEERMINSARYRMKGN